MYPHGTLWHGHAEMVQNCRRPAEAVEGLDRIPEDHPVSHRPSRTITFSPFAHLPLKIKQGSTVTLGTERLLQVCWKCLGTLARRKVVQALACLVSFYALLTLKRKRERYHAFYRATSGRLLES